MICRQAVCDPADAHSHRLKENTNLKTKCLRCGQSDIMIHTVSVPRRQTKMVDERGGWSG